MNRFCSECGQKIGTEQVFCPECGAQQQIIEPVKSEVHPQLTATTSPRRQMSFKKKLSLTLIALLAVALIGGHHIIKANTSPQEKLDDFLQALYSGEPSSVLDRIIVAENVGKDEAAYQEYLVSQDLENFKSRLYEAAGGVVEDGITRIVFHEDGTELFRIMESKFIGMYPGIQIEAIPLDVTLLSDFEGGTFKLGDKPVVTENGDVELGSFLPGNYTCPVSMENGTIEKSVNLDCRIWGSEDVVLDVSIKDMSVEIWTNHEDSIVFINGESTGKSVEEMNLIGLLNNGDTVDIYVERTNDKGEPERSEEVTASAGSFIELPVFTSDSSGYVNAGKEDSEEDEETETVSLLNEETLGTFISDFRSAYESSLNNKDFSYIDAYLKEGSIARKELVEFIGDIGDDYYFYEFLVDEVTDFKILEDKAYVTTFEEFDFTNHLDVVTNYTRSKKYEIHPTEDGKLQIAKIEIMDTVRDN